MILALIEKFKRVFGLDRKPKKIGANFLLMGPYWTQEKIGFIGAGMMRKNDSFDLGLGYKARL